MITLSDYAGLQPAWCPGCGNFGILKALVEVLNHLKRTVMPKTMLHWLSLRSSESDYTYAV